MCTNPKRFVKRYAKDFLFLARAARCQVSDSRRRAVVQEPISAEVAAVHGYQLRCGRWEDGALAVCNELSSERGDLLVDCSSVERLGASELGQLCEAARQCHRRGQYFAIVRPSSVVAKKIAHQKLDAQLPTFAHLGELANRRAPAGHGSSEQFAGWSKDPPRSGRSSVWK